MPSNAKLLPFRSNVPYLADYCLTPCDPTFPERAKAKGGGIIVAGSNYGQGSSREHAALAPLQLGIRAVIAVSFARIHMANLINSGILPLTFTNGEDYAGIQEGDVLSIHALTSHFDHGGDVRITVESNGTRRSFEAAITLSDRQAAILRAGGLLNYTRQGGL
jgi:aconitate hydratase